MKFEKGQWYSDGKRFYQYDCESHPTKNTHYQFRIAGCNEPSVVFYRLNDLVMLTPASLTPDFSNAKVGDECFDSAHGQGFIRTIPCDAVGHYASSFTIVCGNTTYHMDEAAMRFPVTKHPTLFNSFAQFQAYWQEEALKLKGGEE